MDRFLIIAITSPRFFSGESEKIIEILEKFPDLIMHIRKPNASKKDIENLIKEIPYNFHQRLKLHDHFDLIKSYKLGGIHLNSRNSISLPDVNSKSISIHSLDEIDTAETYDYFFISPVFESISKKGYKPKFTIEEIKEKIQGKRAVALGGVTPDKFQLLKSIGFYGAALLGYFFHEEITKRT